MPALAYDKLQRRVIAIDSRERGESEHDANLKNYNLSIELGDLHPEMIADAVLHTILGQ